MSRANHDDVRSESSKPDQLRALQIFESLVELPQGHIKAELAALQQTSPGVAETVRQLLSADASPIDAGSYAAQVSKLLRSSAPQDFVVPERVGRFVLLHKVGEGASGVVFAASDPAIDQTVAMKLLRSAMTSVSERERFHREAETLARLDHPNIAKIFQFGVTETGMPYIAMQFVDGDDIASFVREHKLSVRERCGLFLQACEAMAHAHNKGVIHRDIKPSNLLVSEGDGSPQCRVIDFGIAQATAFHGQSQDRLTQTGALLGTPGYMSPEQLSLIDDDVDTRSDVYSLGLVFYELITGRGAFTDGGVSSTTMKTIMMRIHAREVPLPSRSFGSKPNGLPYSSIPIEFDWICSKATAQNLSERYQSVAALADDLERYLSGRPITAAPPSAVYQAKKLIARHKSATLAIVVVVAILIGATALSLYFAFEAEQDRERAQTAVSERDQQLRVSQFRLIARAIDDNELPDAKQTYAQLVGQDGGWLDSFFESILEPESFSQTSILNPSFVKLHPESAAVAIGGYDGRIEVLDNGRVTVLKPAVQDRVTAIQWSRDGGMILCVHGTDHWTVYEVKSGSSVRSGVRQNVASDRPFIRRQFKIDDVRSTTDGELRGTHTGQKAKQNGRQAATIEVLNDQDVVAHTQDGRSVVLVAGARKLEPLQFNADSSKVLVAYLSSDGYMAALYDLGTLTVNDTLLDTSAGRPRIRLSESGDLLAVVYRTGVTEIWTSSPLRRLRTFRVPLALPFAFDVNDKYLAIAQSDGIIQWRPLDGPSNYDFWHSDRPVQAVELIGNVAHAAVSTSVSPDKNEVNVCSTNLPERAYIRHRLLKKDGVWVSLTINGQVVVCSEKHPCQSFSTGLSTPVDFEISADEQCVYVRTLQQQLVCYSLDSFEEIFRRDDLGFLQAAASSTTDGTLAVIDINGTISLLSKRGATLATFKGGRRANCMRFGRDGRTLYVGGADGTIDLWDTRAGRRIGSLKPHAKQIVSIFETPNADGLVSFADGEKPEYSSLRTPTLTITLPSLVKDPVYIDLALDGTLLLANRVGETSVVRPLVRN